MDRVAPFGGVKQSGDRFRVRPDSALRRNVTPKVTTNASFQSGFLMPDGASYGKDLTKVPAAKQDLARTAYADFAYQVTQISQSTYLASQHQIVMQLLPINERSSGQQSLKRLSIAALRLSERCG